MTKTDLTPAGVTPAGVLAYVLLLVAAAMGAQECSLASGGKASTELVLGDEPCAASRHMANVLRAMLGKITGATFAITAGDGSAGIAVGMASEFPELVDDPGLKLKQRFAPTDLATRQSYVSRTHAAGVHIIGASEVAVLYGGWDLLHRLGYRRFFPHEAWEVIPKRRDLSIAVDVFEKPDYIARRIAGSVTADWNERNRTSIGYSWKVPMKPYIPECWQKPLVQNHHNWGAIIGHSREEFEAHPEYLGLVTVKIESDTGVLPPPKLGKKELDALVDGDDSFLAGLKEATDGDGDEKAAKTELRRASSKLCVSNPGVRRAAARYALHYFKNAPETPSVSLEPTDGSGWCECEQCAKVGPPSERVALLANHVARALEHEFPDKYLGILAYHLHADPPVRRLHPRVAVSLATALSGRTPLSERLAGWAKVCGNLGVYEYLSVMEWHLGMPAKSLVANLPALIEKIPAYHEKNVRFFTGQATGGAWGGHGLGYYVLSRLLWDIGDAEQVPAIVDDFLEKAFGAAAEPMREYYRVIDGSQAKPGSGAFFLDRAARMYGALRSAKKATTDPAIRRRLNQLVLYTRYVELFGHEAEARRTDEHFPALVRLVRFAYRIRNEGIVGAYGMVRAYVKNAKKVPLRSDLLRMEREEKQRSSLERPEPLVHYVDKPITEEDIQAILQGKATIRVPEADLMPSRPQIDLRSAEDPQGELDDL